VNVYPFIDAEKKSTSHRQRGGNVKRSCELLGVSRSAYYADAATQAAGGSARARQDAVITAKIIQFHDDSKGTYGSPRVHAAAAGRADRANLLRTSGGPEPRQQVVGGTVQRRHTCPPTALRRQAAPTRRRPTALSLARCPPGPLSERARLSPVWW
jgi:hypothetical protein